MSDLNLDEWNELGVKIKEVGEFIHKINSSYRKLPKRVKDINKFFLLLKSELDNQVCSEYVDSSVEKIFFGINGRNLI